MQIPQLTFTRFVAAVAVVIVHFGLFTWPFDTEILSQLANKGTVAVSYFFLLSGFILVIATFKNNVLTEVVEDIKGFWIKRAARILPLYLLSITIYFCFHFEYNPDIPLRWQIQSFIYSIFLLQNWNFAAALDVNFPVWSLSVEAFLYFLFPWLYWQLNRCSTKKLIIIATLFWAANTFLFSLLKDGGAPHNFMYYFPMLHVATFLGGIAAGIIFIRHTDVLSRKHQVLMVLTGVSTLFLAYTAYKNWGFHAISHNGLLSPYFILVIYTLCVLKGPLLTFFASKPLVFLGEISYALYVFQVPVLEFSTKYIPFFQGKEIKDIFYYYLILLLLVSIFMHLCIEQPVRRGINKLFTR